MKSLTEQVRAALAGEILAGKYAPGDYKGEQYGKRKDLCIFLPGMWL